MNRQIGAILMIVGTEVGGGILALPILVAHFGFIIGAILLFLMWLLMTYTTFMVCDINLAMETGTSFAGMANKLFGSFGTFVVWVSFLLILYPILIAYLSAAGSTFGLLLHVSPQVAGIVFEVILGVIVLLGTSKVDWVNRLLLGTKLSILLFVCIALTSHANLSYLGYMNQTNLAIPILIALPIFVTSFVGHIIIPTLRVYLESDEKILKRIIWIGCGTPLLLYLIWLIAIIGNIPPYGKDSLEQVVSLGDKANVGDILKVLQIHLRENYFIEPVSVFTSISVSTSFLSVALSLKDFLTDGLNLRKLNRLLQTAILVGFVFVIPIMITFLYPDLFIKALGVVGVSCIVLLIIVPVMMVAKLKKMNHKFKFALVEVNLINKLTFICGITLLCTQLIKY